MTYLPCPRSSPFYTAVLDPFMGTGTTGLAYKNLNRNFIGIEMLDKHMEVVKGRLNV